MATALGIARVEAGCGRHRHPVVAVVARHRRRGLAAVHARSLEPVVVLDSTDLGQLRMHPRQVVVLLVVLADELPVGRDLDVAALDGAPRFEPVGPQAIGKVAEPVVQWHGRRVETGEHEGSPASDADPVQPVFGGIEVVDACFGEPGCGDQGAIEVVAPSVVWAPDRVGQVAVGCRQFGTPVAAAVEEAPQFAVAAAGDEDRRTSDRPHEQAAGDDLIGQRDRHPTGAEHSALFELEEGRVGVGSGRQCRRPRQWPAGPGPGRLGAPVRRRR